MENEKCPNCGAELRENAKFCDECGTKLNSEIAEQAFVPTEKTDVFKEEKKHNTIGIVFCIAIVVLLFGIFIVRFSSNNSAGNTNTAVQYGKQYAKDVVIHWYHIDATAEDDYNVYTPYFENGYVYIPIEAQINASNTVQHRGFGVASIRDSFDKTVPIKYDYEKSTVEKGVYQKLTLRIPVTDLEVQRPTTLYCQLSVFVAGQQQRINLEFDISW
ncbi:MAG: zinc-ribbon domain-containing protein [Oscillospiraceae bacterium]|nr:zinc-ribbon domain-containing protein [Oscillospiraceae bacterium]